MSLRAQLIYSFANASFKDSIDKVLRNASTVNVQVDSVDVDQLSQNDETRFLSDIRTVPPQIRGQVKSGGGRTLPISGSGKLNRSIPILILYENDRPLDVYPKDVMGVRYDLSLAFSNIKGISAILGIENSLTEILVSKPDILEPGLTLDSKELDTGSGVIDLVFKDKNEQLLIIEVKEEANQETVGQILKQSNGLKTRRGLFNVRKAIVALRAAQNVQAACKDSGIELYLVTLQKHT